jgi:peptidoglycan/xylan/chitin deacetylase (PgdA/CDA1 family)
VLLDPPAGWDGRLSYSDPTHGANIKSAEFNFLLDQMSLDSVDLEAWPTAGATRGEAAQLVWNLLVLEEPHDPPVITTVTPSSISPSGDAAVTIIGSGFTKVSKVTFGETETWFRVESDARITTAAPPPALAEAGGTVEVRVITRFGTSAAGSQAQYSYDAHSTKPGRPTVAAIDPATGPIGTVVTIRGTGFGDATAVRFGGIPAAGFTVVSPDQIQAVAPIPWKPDGDGLLPVTVANPAGTSEPVDTTLFAYETDRVPAGEVDAVNIPVLMYHYVDDTPPLRTANAETMTVRTADFRRQMQYLADNGYQAVSFEDIYLAAVGARALPQKPVALTFDDGGSDNYSVVFPLLRQVGFTATFFVATKSVGSLGRVTWDQLREMSAAGMSIQSHTVSHHKLTATSDTQLRLELENSRAAIMREIGRPAYVLSYPGGAFDGRVTQAVAAAGYLMAVTTDDARTAGDGDLYAIGRGGVCSSTTLGRFAELLR